MNAVFNDKMIYKLMKEGVKIVDPFDEDFLQPASIDLRLGSVRYKYLLEKYVLGEVIDEQKFAKEQFDSLVLKDGECAFVGIHERISIPNNAIGIVIPRSGITRLGLNVIVSYMNPGYSGHMPLTIVNHTGVTVTLKPGYRVVQLILLSMFEEPTKLYKDIEDVKYYDEKVEPSRLHMDKEISRLLDEVIEQETPSLYKLMKDASL
ncbi:MAG: dCTP deaminase [Pseudomonadota bacterium]|nr:dCTP deaminase [Pseudomonadota bacterium]